MHNVYQDQSIIHLTHKGFQCFKGVGSNFWEERGGTSQCAIRCHPWRVRHWEWLLLSHVWSFLRQQRIANLVGNVQNEFQWIQLFVDFCCSHLTQKLLLGWGKKTEVAPKDSLFIILFVLTTATHWDFMGEIFERKGPTPQRMFSCAVETLSPISYNEFVNNTYTSKGGPIQTLPICSVCNRCYLPTGKPSFRNYAWRQTLF